MCSADLFLGLLAILFPPLPVWVKMGICSADSVINILLCVLGYIPGLLHAWYIIAKFPDPVDAYERVPPRDSERARVRYVYVGSNDDPRQQQYQQRPHQLTAAPSANKATTIHQQPQPHHDGPGMNYGTTNPHHDQASSSSGQGQGQAQGQPGGSSSNPHAPAPPSYDEAVRPGDHKVQTRD